MKITFVVPLLNLSGGLRVVSIYSRMLAAKGHEVTVVSRNRRLPTLKEKLKSLIGYRGYLFKNNFDPAFFIHTPANLKVLESFRPVTERDVPDADVVIATFWNTAEWVMNFPASKGHKVYFIQHHEVHPWIPSERIHTTLKHDFKKIAVAQWIADILAEEYDDPDVLVVPNGVDTAQFSAPVRSKQHSPTVGTMYSSKTFKGFDTALAAFELAKKSVPDLKMKLFGAEILDFSLPSGCSYTFKPQQEQLNAIYAGCDAWLFTSRYEGFGLPILEAMACRTPVIGTLAGAAPDLIDNANGLLVEVDNISAIAQAIVNVAQMSQDKWRGLSNNAYETSLRHTWEQSSEKFEQVLKDLTESQTK